MWYNIHINHVWSSMEFVMGNKKGSRKPTKKEREQLQEMKRQGLIPQKDK